MGAGINRFVGVLIAGSMFVSSTAAFAGPSIAPAPQINPWAALTAMSGGAPAAALCGAAVVAAAGQTPGPGCVLPAVDAAPAVAEAGPPQPIPVPPVEPAGGGLGVNPLLLALGVLAAGVLVYFLVRHHNNNPTSPA